MTNKWKRRSLPTPLSITRRWLLFPIAFLFLISLFFYLSHDRFASDSLSSILSNARREQFPQCSRLRDQAPGEKFLWYAPHSGFSNQFSELKNALLMAAILNRTLVVPPVLDHHAVALGSCPKFRVLNPDELRFSVWNHSMELIRSRRYISMGDIMDFSAVLSESAVKAIDFRVFASMWCDVNVDLACYKRTDAETTLAESMRKCGLLLSGYNGNVDNCLYAVHEDCRTTVWTYQRDSEDGALDIFQPDEQLKKKRKISFVRRRKDVYKTIGPVSEAGNALILTFGSLFTAPYKGSQSYIDISEAPRNPKIQFLIEKLEYIPFFSEILQAGKEFATETIKAPFICAQLRLLDGQFKNHWKATFYGLKQKLESLKQGIALPIHVFLMTDLPVSNWTGNYLGDLSRDSDFVKLYFLKEEDELVRKTAIKLADAGHGLKHGSVNKSLGGIMNYCHPQLFPDILLYIEEAVCSCASLGFVATAGSTIAESIESMRKHSTCLG